VELLTKLGIDWGLLIAQTVNFLILLGALSFLLFKPILNVLDRRRAMIEKSVADANTIEEQLKEMEKIKAEKLAELDRECGEILERTKAEAEAMRQEVLKVAEREAEKVLERGRLALANEREEAMREISLTLTTAIVRATEKILKREFAGADQNRLLRDIEGELSSLRA
jgi:F-type H+-transporting ATPase subunit b